MSQNSAGRIVSFKEINDIANAGTDGYIIDVRTREELQETGSIPNSVNVPRKFTMGFIVSAMIVTCMKE